MQLVQKISRSAVLSVAALLLVACSGQKEPAGKLIADVETTVMAASSEAAKYVPEQLANVQSKLDSLKADYGKQDYVDVVTKAPEVLSAAQNLATAAAAKKDEILKALDDQWTGLAGTLPGYMAAIQNRIDIFSKKSGKKSASAIDLDAAKAGLVDAGSLWSKAQAAFASGNLQEAVTTANDVKAKLTALASVLKMDL
jgi:hypothetical protein